MSLNDDVADVEARSPDGESHDTKDNHVMAGVATEDLKSPPVGSHIQSSSLLLCDQADHSSFAIMCEIRIATDTWREENRCNAR